MNVLVRTGRWLLHRLRLRSRRSATGSTVKLGRVVRSRLSSLDATADWPGKQAILEIGSHEWKLQNAVDSLGEIEFSDLPTARRAREVRSDISSVLSPGGRLHELVAVWPSEWTRLSHRYVALNEDLVRASAIAREVIDAASEARRHRRALSTLAQHHGAVQPKLWTRVSSELDLDGSIERIESPQGATSAGYRLTIAEALLKEAEVDLAAQASGLHSSLPEGADESRSAGCLEQEVAQLRARIPEWCAERVGRYERVVSATFETHLGRLNPPGDKALRTRMKATFDTTLEGPLRQWARIHHAKIAAPQKRRS